VAVVRRRASKAVLGSPGATPASTQPGGRPPAPETLGPAHPDDPCPESAEGAGPPAERSRSRGPGFRSGLVPERALWPCPSTPSTPSAPPAGQIPARGGRAGAERCWEAPRRPWSGGCSGWYGMVWSVTVQSCELAGGRPPAQRDAELHGSPGGVQADQLELVRELVPVGVCLSSAARASTHVHDMRNLRGSLDQSMRFTCPAQRSFRLEMTWSRLVRPRAVYIGARAGRLTKGAGWSYVLEKEVRCGRAIARTQRLWNVFSRWRSGAVSTQSPHP
jgi:hypothetical protein